jgi:hypothetical protein
VTRSQAANWLIKPETTPNATPPEMYYAFSHTRDELLSFTTISSVVWRQAGTTESFSTQKGQRNKETKNKNEPRPTFAPLTLCVMNFMPVLAEISCLTGLE